MISKSTKKNRRRMISVNKKRSKIVILLVEKCDLWKVGVKLDERNIMFRLLSGKDNAIKRMRRLSSSYASQ